MLGYTKLFQSIITSTVWQEPNDLRVLWITMLALKERDHVCRATIPALAKITNISVEQCQEYIKKLESPDPYSRTKAFDGRRIQQTDDGYLILNGKKYTEKMNSDERREYHRVKMAELRAKRKSVNTCDQMLTKVPHTDTDTDTDTDTKKKNKKRHKKSASQTEPNGSVHPLIGYFRDKYKEKTSGGVYLPQWGPDGATMKRLLKALGEDKTKQIINAYFDDTWTRENTGFTITGLNKFVNRHQSKVEKLDDWRRGLRELKAEMGGDDDDRPI